MRKFVITFLIFPFGVVFSQNVQNEIIYTIVEGHTIVTNENRFALGCGPTDFCIVTKWKGEFYAVHNGTKTGPFADMQEAFKKCQSVEGEYNEFESRVLQENIWETNVISYDDNSKVILKQGAKQFGPFDMLQMVWLSPDKKNFYACCTLNNENYFVSSLYGVVKLNGYVSVAHKSACGNNSLVVVSTGKDLMQELMNANLSEMTDEELQQYLEQINQAAETESNPDYFIVTADNKVFGPYTEQLMEGPMYSVSAKTNWHMVYDKKLIVNGVQVVDFGDEYVNPSQIWVSSDGKQIAWSTWDKLVFHNGKSYDYPLHINYCVENGKYWLVWIAFDGKSFIKYKCDF
jgi:hypothetical protein